MTPLAKIQISLLLGSVALMLAAKGAGQLADQDPGDRWDAGYQAGRRDEAAAAAEAHNERVGLLCE